MANPDGSPSEELIEYNAKLAAGGVGLLVTGNSHIRRDSTGNQALYIDRDEFVPAYSRLAEAIHSQGAVVFGQLVHSGRQTDADRIEGEPVAPSALPYSGVTPRVLSEEEILELIELHAVSAQRIKDASFDGIQLHAAHGYLISQFNSPYTNTRQDRWGGSSEGRRQFICETYKALRAAVGPDFPITIKVNMDDLKSGGLVREEAAGIVFALEKLGLDAVEISSGIGDSDEDLLRGRKRWEATDHCWHLPYARYLKELGLQIPIVVVGAIREKGIAEGIIESGAADFVAFSRPFINNPGFPNLWRKGEMEVLECRSCGKCSRKPGEPVACCFAE
jgi:2,4-dienoyl-CoA reductase-like NADH-dependent reductase (Old Yellow Enzyme family)